ncbi:hypothetical protein Ltuc_1565 [Legionella tucsonensis]|uniref:Uncharacterized protein n=2 Tax=Legionella tucsonensis TaxID=40335 RepID=A0A0W0ZXH2_9GAMM|nr:hypothetical protein Ltuc_1565 [Legionella tucsonensis]
MFTCILLFELGMIAIVNRINNESMMKKLIFIMALLPLNTFAIDPVNPNLYANNDCESIQDPAEKKDCFNIEKKNEAEENFRNFQENNPAPYQEEF